MLSGAGRRGDAPQERVNGCFFRLKFPRCYRFLPWLGKPFILSHPLEIHKAGACLRQCHSLPRISGGRPDCYRPTLTRRRTCPESRNCSLLYARPRRKSPTRAGFATALGLRRQDWFALPMRRSPTRARFVSVPVPRQPASESDATLIRRGGGRAAQAVRRPRLLLPSRSAFR